MPAVAAAASLLAFLAAAATLSSDGFMSEVDNVRNGVLASSSSTLPKDKLQGTVLFFNVDCG